MTATSLGPNTAQIGEPSNSIRAPEPLSIPGLPDCHSRRAFDSSLDIYFCAHPRMHSKDGLVTRNICRVCKYWQHPPPEQFRPYPTRFHVAHDGLCVHLGELLGLQECPTCSGKVQRKVFQCLHPEHDTTTISDCTRCFDYEPRLSRGTIRRWAVGLTTAPRAAPTLERTLKSVAAAGWSELRIFAEPGSEIPVGPAHVSVTWRESTVGAWPNWWLGLAELYQRDPQADAYLMLQDDLVCCRNVRSYLERELWPAERVGLVSFYCPSVYGSAQSGFRQIRIGDGLIGALTYVISPAAVRSVLTHGATLAHRLRGTTVGTRSIDTVVGQWAQARRFPVFCHVPSLAQHIGTTSTLWPGAGNGGQRMASHFVGEEYDSLELAAPQETPPRAAWDKANKGDATSSALPATAVI
jgi:hypothetical protein